MGLVASLLAFIALQNYMLRGRRGPHPSYLCVSNLRQIDGAKQLWALANHRAGSDIPELHQIVKYLRNKTTPVCPAGGVYSINAVSADPTCTRKDLGHTL